MSGSSTAPAHVATQQLCLAPAARLCLLNRLCSFGPVPLCPGTALAGILAVLLAGGLDMKATLAGKQHYLLYCLTPAMKPRMLMTGAPRGAMPPAGWVLALAAIHACLLLSICRVCMEGPGRDAQFT